MLKPGFTILLVAHGIAYALLTNFSPTRVELLMFLSGSFVLLSLGLISAKLNPSPELLNAIRMGEIAKNVKVDLPKFLGGGE